MKKILFTLLAAGVLASAASAQTVVNASSIYELTSSGATEINSTDKGAIVGTQKSTSYSASMTFLLSGITMGDVTSVDLSLLSNGGAVAVNADNGFDLYAAVISADTEAAVAPGYVAYTAGSSTSAPTGYTTIENAFHTGSVTDGTLYSLSSTGQANLLSFLNSNYSEDDYLVVSMGMFATDGGGNFDRSRWLATNGTDNSTLEFTVIPEPSTFALLAGVLGLGLVMLRRRRA